ncbi:neprilysin-2-like [Ixodes scapularis]
MKTSYIQACKSCHSKELATLPGKLRGVKPVLGNLDDDVQAYIVELGEGGGVVNSRICIAAALRIVRATKPTLLPEFGGTLVLDRPWARSFLNRIGFVKRKATKTAQNFPNDFEVAKKKFLQTIDEKRNHFSIPDDLVLNWDQTGVKLVPASKWTMKARACLDPPMCLVLVTQQPQFGLQRLPELTPVLIGTAKGSASKAHPDAGDGGDVRGQTLTTKRRKIDWDRYFNSLLVDKVTPDEPISVVVPEFVKQFESLILRTPARTVANYMVWRAVLQSYGMLGKPWRERLQEFIGVLTGQTREMARWEQCIGSLTGYLGMALSSLYVRHFFQEDSKGAALDMVNFILKEFMAILDDIDWMDEQTRQRARAKALAIQPYIGYPEELLKDALVGEHYRNVKLQPDTYFENVMRLRKWYTDYEYGHLRKPHIKGKWENLAQVAVVNAYYNSQENCIMFPAGILQGVFFSKDRPNYLNYGAIGSVIGHEITHGFDDQGRQFDKDGNNLNWWEPETDLKFRQRAQCIVEQYGNYTVAEGTLNINGVNTQGENIADNGGIKEAFKSW